MADSVGIQPGRGLELETETRDALAQLENPDPVSETEPVLSAQSNDILKWFVAMVDRPGDLPSTVHAEQKSYFRALFNMSIDKRTRKQFVERPGALQTLVRFLEKLRSDENLGTFMAAIANLIYEDPSKTRLMIAGNIPALFTTFLESSNAGVATHTARAVFSLTTVFEYKKKFSSHEGLLRSLVACLTRDSNQLVMNAAGAIANIAIHPESKLPIVQMGALDPLMEISRVEDEEGVLHQVSRCLFSLAAEKQNRVLMCDKGIMSIISRLLGFTRHTDILTNAIGCFGNLAMSQCAASDAVVMALRLLPMLGASTSSTLDRQATRVLLSFASKDQLRAAMGETKNLEILVRKLDAKDTHIIRDVLGLLTATTYNSQELKQAVCDIGGLRKIIDLFTSYISLGSSSDLVAPLVRALFAMVGCTDAKEAVCGERQGRIIRHLSELILHGFAPNPHPNPSVAVIKHALGTLATVACDEKHIPTLLRHGVLKCGIVPLFESSKQDVRRQAGRLIYNITRRHGVALTYMCRFGGLDGERLRLDVDLKAMFRESFSILPIAALDFSTSSSLTLAREKYSKMGLAAIQVRCRVPSGDGLTVQPYLIVAPAGLLKARFSDALARLTRLTLTERAWTLLFEFILTNSMSAGADDLFSSGDGINDHVYDVLSEMGFHSVSGEAMQEVVAALLNAGVPGGDIEQPIFGLQSGAAGPTMTLSCSSAGSTSISAPAASDPSGGENTDESACASAKDDVDPSTIGELTKLSNEWTKCMVTRLLSGRGRRPGMSRAANGDVFLRPDTEDPCCSLGDLSQNENSPMRCSPGPITRARRRAAESLGQPGSSGGGPSPAQPSDSKIVYGDFVARLIQEWMIQPPSCTSPGRKRRIQEIQPENMLFRADKHILAARSRYFQSLLRGPFSESHCNDGEYVIDFRGPADTLVIVLRYIHCGIDPELADALRSDQELCWRSLMTAHEYGLEGLQYHCESVIVESLVSLDDASVAADLVQDINAPFVKLYCANLAYTNRTSKLRGLAISVLEKVGMPLTLIAHPARNPRNDSGGIEHSDGDGSDQPDSAHKKISGSVLGVSFGARGLIN